MLLARAATATTATTAAVLALLAIAIIPTAHVSAVLTTPTPVVVPDRLRVRYDNHQLLSIPRSNPTLLGAVKSLGLDVWSRGSDSWQVQAPPAFLDLLNRLDTDKKIRVLNPNIQDTIDEETKRLRAQRGEKRTGL